jgi:hypothetical protein
MTVTAVVVTVVVTVMESHLVLVWCKVQRGHGASVGPRTGAKTTSALACSACVRAGERADNGLCSPHSVHTAYCIHVHMHSYTHSVTQCCRELAVVAAVVAEAVAAAAAAAVVLLGVCVQRGERLRVCVGHSVCRVFWRLLLVVASAKQQ